MLNEVRTVISGNLTAEIELRFINSGKAVASFTIASTPRYRQADGSFQDGEANFIPCELWGPPAENLAQSVGKGARLIVSGLMRTDRWETEQGEKRSRLKLVADEVGASVAFATLKVSKATRERGPELVDPFTGETATETARPAGV